MDRKKLEAVLADHAAWLRGEGEARADLWDANLRDADLRDANLRGADLWRANLGGADLGDADLRDANLRGADLWRANLRGADLRRANLRDANLRFADLWRANLRDADLRGADLWRANLRGASLPAPCAVIMARWYEISDDLTADLMRWDAANHPDPRAFDAWAHSEGPCPYNDVRIQRACYFPEKRELWKPGPPKRPINIMIALLRECCKDSDYHDGGNDAT